MSFFNQKIDQEAIVKKYFSDPEKELTLKKGEVLLEQNEINHRLFYVVSGKISGYLPNKHISEPVFEATSDSFVGVYSYFSEDHKSYTKVMAGEDSIISYFDGDPFDLPSADFEVLLAFLFNIVILELRSRQHFAGEMAHEHEATMHKLIQTEKLATLGQMSAGLAHELNNTIGSLSGNLRQLEEDISNYFIKNQTDEIKSFYQKGLTEGQQLTSIEARKARKKWEEYYELDKASLKRLTKSGLKPKDLLNKNRNLIKIASFWNLGYLIHDMKIAADQAAHVISSIKTMGISNQNWSKEVNINATFNDALAIVRNLTKKVNIKIDLNESLPSIEACSGELVQVWINLLKNAVESLVNHEVENPTVWVKTYEKDNSIFVSVADNGIGIPKNIIDKIYEPSFTTKVKGLSLGLGLGLTIVRRIIDEHEGKITLSSNPGKTKFIIELNKSIS